MNIIHSINPHKNLVNLDILLKNKNLTKKSNLTIKFKLILNFFLTIFNKWFPLYAALLDNHYFFGVQNTTKLVHVYCSVYNFLCQYKSRHYTPEFFLWIDALEFDKTFITCNNRQRNQYLNCSKRKFIHYEEFLFFSPHIHLVNN